MQTSLVTGGAGFIGSHLVEALLAEGRRVLVLDDFSTGAIANLERVRQHPNLQIVMDSISNEIRLTELVEQADEVYHLAAVVGVRLVLDEPARTVATHVGPTEMILRLVDRQHKPLFLASTSEVYGKNPRLPLNEDDDLVLGPTSKGRWIYACSKALDEYLALSYHKTSGLPVVVGRFFNVVGPRQVGRYGMVLPRFVDQALSGGPLVVYDDGQQVRCFGHVADIVRGILALMACPAAHGKVFNLGSDEATSIRGLAERVARFIDPGLRIEHIPYAKAYAPGFEDIRSRVPDLGRIRSTIGFEPRFRLDDILREVIAWRRGQSPQTYF
ncbi:MAG TPA: GDP-mannose 4,6-dehydratase [Gemmataceae bacterium]|nr:GDP-mannose 4,6-dehydratase [Gemmataceae bacterium]